MLEGCSAETMRGLVGRNIMVSRTNTAAERWQAERSRVVTPGLTAAEWPETDYSRGNVVLLQPWDHARFYNTAAVSELAAEIGNRLSRVGRGRNRANFDVYRSLLSSSSIYFNPAAAVPCPQTMVEAQLCGLAVVTTDAHGESSYIVNGENGFAANDMNALYAQLRFLLSNPNEVRRIGANGRRTAQRIFSGERFLAEWNAILAEAVDGARLSAVAGE
jgi:glycosyltransferase involved in cell wall biosynthesis